MKKYRLLKDLPGLPAGTTIGYDAGDVFVVDNVKYSTDLLPILRDIFRCCYEWWIEEIKEEPKSIYELRDWWTYFYINDKWEIIKHDWLLREWFKKRLEIWNIFLTEQEAEKELEKKKAMSRIKKWIYENNAPLWLNRDKNWIYHWWYRIVYYKDTDELKIILETAMTIDGIMFMYKSDAKRCLEECRNEWHILFDLK